MHWRAHNNSIFSSSREHGHRQVWEWWWLLMEEKINVDLWEKVCNLHISTMYLENNLIEAQLVAHKETCGDFSRSCSFDNWWNSVVLSRIPLSRSLCTHNWNVAFFDILEVLSQEIDMECFINILIFNAAAFNDPNSLLLGESGSSTDEILISFSTTFFKCFLAECLLVKRRIMSCYKLSSISQIFVFV